MTALPVRESLGYAEFDEPLVLLVEEKKGSSAETSDFGLPPKPHDDTGWEYDWSHDDGGLVGFGNVIKMMWGFRLPLHQLQLDQLGTVARLRTNEFLVITTEPAICRRPSAGVQPSFFSGDKTEINELTFADSFVLGLLRGFWILQAAGLTPDERRVILSSTRGFVEFEEITKALQTLWDEQFAGQRHQVHQAHFQESFAAERNEHEDQSWEDAHYAEDRSYYDSSWDWPETYVAGQFLKNLKRILKKMQLSEKLSRKLGSWSPAYLDQGQARLCCRAFALGLPGLWWLWHGSLQGKKGKSHHGQSQAWLKGKGPRHAGSGKERVLQDHLSTRITLSFFPPAWRCWSCRLPPRRVCLAPTAFLIAEQQLDCKLRWKSWFLLSCLNTTRHRLTSAKAIARISALGMEGGAGHSTRWINSCVSGQPRKFGFNALPNPAELHSPDFDTWTPWFPSSLAWTICLVHLRQWLLISWLVGVRFTWDWTHWFTSWPPIERDTLFWTLSIFSREAIPIFLVIHGYMSWKLPQHNMRRTIS